MTREDIEKCFQYHEAGAAMKYYYQERERLGEIEGDNVVNAFEAGAEWAQEFIIERACEWLELHVNDDKYYSCIGEETLMPYLLEDFKQAMEE